MVIRPGLHLTRGGKEVYIAIRCSVDRYNAPNAYPWWVEDRKGGYWVDDTGRHMKGGTTIFDIVSKAARAAGE